MRGKLIVITGVDGSGKTVQTKLLCERLLKEGYPVVTTDFSSVWQDFLCRYGDKISSG